MLPLILAGASMLASGIGSASAAASTVSGAKQQAAIGQKAITNRRSIQDDLTLRNKPYYDQGIAQLPGILAMSGNPDFSATDPAYGDKYSQGANQMRLSALGRSDLGGIAPMDELNANFDNSERARLLNRRLDMLKVGYGQAGTAGQSLMNTGTAVADIGQRIGQAQANALSLRNLGRQQTLDSMTNDAAYVPLYLNYKRLNAGGQ